MSRQDAGGTKPKLGEGIADELFVAAEFGEGGFGEKAKDDGAGAFREIGGGGGVADDGGGFFEAALPMRLAGIAEKKTVGGKSGGDENRAR